jgi:hypothetical protein
MRKLINLAVLLLFFGRSYAQGAYQPGNLFNDAWQLQQQLLSAAPDAALETRILGYYKLRYTTDLAKNVFLNQLFPGLLPAPPANDRFEFLRGVFPAAVPAAATSTGSSTGGITVANFADGLAKFLVSRFKEELSMAFFQQLQKDLNSPKLADLKILFPQTWKTLQTIDNGIYQFSVYLNTLRQAFIQDLTNGFTNLQNVLQQQKYKDFFDNQHPELGTVLYSSLYLINSLSAGKHPGQVLAGFNDESLIHLCKTDGSPCLQGTTILEANLRAGIRTAQLLSFSLKSASSGHYWVTVDSVKQLLDDATGNGLKVFLGLICQQSFLQESNPNTVIKYAYKDANDHTQYEMLSVVFNALATAHVVANIYQYKAFIETVLDKTDEINQYISAIKAAKKTDIDYNDYYKLYNAFLDLVQQDTSFIQLPYLGSVINPDVQAQIKNSTNTLIYVARSAADLFIDVRTKNYSAAIQSAVTILDTVLDYNAVFNLKKLGNTVGEAKTQLLKLTAAGGADHGDSTAIYALVASYVAAPNQNSSAIDFHGLPEVSADQQAQTAIKTLIDDERQYNEVSNHQTLRNLILKYGSFFAAVAQAQNSDDVEKAIESVALPAGSYTIKQHSSFNISVNGFVGYAYDFNLKGGSYSSGVYAPVGISFNWGLGKKKNWGAASVFLSVLDVGAIVAYRFNDSTDALKQDVRLESILSPSVQGLWEVPNLPVTVCAGWRYTPTLFYSGSQSFTTKEGRNVFNLSLLIDIPIITILNHTKN